MKKILSTLFILTLLWILQACSPQKTYDVIVTDYFTYDIVKNITEDNLEIKMLQPIHLDYHTYEPSSKDLVEISKTKLFIYTSINQAPWLKSSDHLDTMVLNGNHVSLEALSVIQHDHHQEREHDHDDHDHDHDHGFDFISNPVHVAIIIQNLMDYLIHSYPEHEDAFLKAGQAYYNRLMDMVNPYLALTNNALSDIYFVGHNALLGFSEAFNLNIHALDENVSPNSDTTSHQVTNFIKEVKDKNINIIFHEEEPNSQTINYLKAQLPNITLYELHTFHKISKKDYKEGIGYVELMERNLKNLSEGLNL